MSIIIDGYNVILQSGLMPARPGPRALERARNALIGLISSRLAASEMTEVTVVFDAKTRPHDGTETMVDRGVVVRFAVNHDEADALIEELIRQHAAPKKLTVVSSDRRIRKAAKARRAKVVDSETWLYELSQSPPGGGVQTPPPSRASLKEGTKRLTPEQIQNWLDEFDIDHQQLRRIEREIEGMVVDAAANEGGSIGSTAADGKRNEQADEPPFENPFPEGYAEDLLD